MRVVLAGMRVFQNLDAGGVIRSEALRQLRKNDRWYDPKLLDSVEACLSNNKDVSPGVEISVKQLRIGQVLMSNIKLTRGELLASGRRAGDHRTHA